MVYPLYEELFFSNNILPISLFSRYCTDLNFPLFFLGLLNIEEEENTLIFDLAIFKDFWPYKKNLKKFWGMAGWMSRGEEDSRH